MYRIVNTIMNFLGSLNISRHDQEKINKMVQAQQKLESQQELTPEEQFAVDILMKRNEKMLIEHLQKMMEEQHANKS